MKEVPRLDRPREKLMRYGPNRLVPGRGREFTDLVVFQDEHRAQPLIVIDFVDAQEDGLMPESASARAAMDKARRLGASYAVCVAEDESLVLKTARWDEARPAAAVCQDIPKGTFNF